MHADYYITDFGARADASAMNTAAIQKTIDACHDGGGGRVVCPPGDFPTGGLELKSSVEFHLLPGSRLIGSPSLADYAGMRAGGFQPANAPEGAFSLIRAVDAENLAITGAGEINGSGPAFYRELYTSSRGRVKFRKPDTPRPRLVMFYHCRNVRISGITCVDSPCWTFWLMQSEALNVQGVKIKADRRMQNIDGIDLDACRNATISDCIFDTEDDCLAVRAIQQVYDAPAVCENIAVSNCVFNSGCQGIRVGCPSDGAIRNCVFSNITINSGVDGILFEYPARYSSPASGSRADVHDMQFSNITVNAAQSPIRLYVEPGIILKRLSGLTFTHIRARGGAACQVIGHPDTVIRNVCFNNLDISTTGTDPVIFRHCASMRMEHVVMANCAGEK